MKGSMFYRAVSVLLILCLVVCECPESVYARQRGEAVEEQVINSKIKKRGKKDYVIDKTKTSTTYEYEDGKKEHVVYGQDVRYIDENGELIDYDPSLVQIEDKTTENGTSLEGYLYQNKDGDKKQYIPNEISDRTPILMEYDKNQITIRPILLNEKVSIIKDEISEDGLMEIQDKNILDMESGEVQTETKEEFEEIVKEKKEKKDKIDLKKSKSETEDVYEIASELVNDDVTSVDVKSEDVENIYEEVTEIDNKAEYKTEDDKLAFEYTSMENGIKETITLNEKPNTNIFSYEMYTANATPRISEETGEVYIYNNETEELIATIDAPFMNDASNKAYSEDILYQIVKNEEKEDTYFLHMIVSKEYLESEERVYPITIDPTISWATSSYINDAYVIGSTQYNNYNFFTNDIGNFAVGDGVQGIFRTYMNFPSLSSKISGYYVESANLTIYETAKCCSNETIVAHRVTAAWNPSTITWNNKAAVNTTTLASIKTTGTAGTAKTLNLTNYARNIANGTYKDYGIELRASNESGAFTQFYSSRSSNTARRPKLSVVYYEGPTTPSSVTVPNNYIKKGSNLTVNWQGITSKGLSYVQYRIAKYDDATNTKTDEYYIPYSDTTKIGTTASGSQTITATASLPEGCYRFYVRGVDKGGIKGVGLGITLHVDSTIPKITQATISPSTSSELYSKTATPKISWTASDAHFKQMEYSVNGGAYKAMGTAATGSYTLPAGVITTTGKYTIVVRAVDRAGNYSATKTLYYYYDKDVPTFGTITVAPSTNSNVYNKSNVPTISWSGITETSLKSVQVSVNGSAYVQMGTGKSGSYTLASSNFKDTGMYTFNVRAVDTAGNVSTVQKVLYYYDSVNPEAGTITVTPKTSATAISNNATPTVTWSGFKDTTLKQIMCSINDGTAFQIGTATSGTYKLPSSYILATGNYKISVYAVDKAGNKSTAKVVTYYYDKDAPDLEGVTISPETSEELYTTTKDPEITWTGIKSDDLKAVQCSVNGSTYFDMGTTASGKYMLEDSSDLISGKNVILVRAIDVAGNASEAIELVYYCDFTNPEVEVSIINKGNQEITDLVEDGTIKYVVTDEGSGCDTTTVELENKDGEVVKSLYSGTDVTKEDIILDVSELETGEYIARVTCTDKAGNVSISKKEITISNIDKYKPTNIIATGNYNYKTKLSWDGIEKEAYPKAVGYNIYRSDIKEFVPSDKTLVASNVPTSYWYDSDVNLNKTYYYILCAVSINEENEVLGASTYTDALEVAVADNSTYMNHRLGEHGYYSYTSFDTPNGSTKVEQSLGNVFYTQVDTTLPNQEIDFSLTRFYNSQSGVTSMFGDGWDFSLNLQLQRKKDSTSIWLKDSTGAFVEFEYVGGQYKQKIGADYELKKEKNNVISLDNSKELAVPYEYVMTDKTSTRYFFNQSGQIVCMVTTNDAYLQFEYTVTGLLGRIVSDSNKELVMKYDEGSNLVSEITLPDATTLQYAYDGDKLVSMTHYSETKDDWVTYGYKYNENGQLSELIDAEDNVYKIAYDTDKAVCLTYPTNDKLEIIYNEKDKETVTKKVSSTGAQLYTETITYDETTGYVTKLTDALGIETFSTYENHLLKMQKTTNSYQEIKDNKVVWNTYEKTTTYSYTPNENVKEVADSDGITESYKYSDKDPNLVETVSEMDEAGELLNHSYYEYDEDGNVTLSEDKLSDEKEEYNYTESSEGGLIVSTTETLNGVVVANSEETYDAHGTVLKNEEEIKTNEVNGNNIKTSEKNTYDEMGRLIESIDQKERVTKYLYDFLGREINVIHTTEGVTISESKTYYPNSQIKTETSKDGTITSYKYDELNRVVSKTIEKDGVSKTWLTEYSYGDVSIYTGKNGDKETIKNIYIEKETNPDGDITSIRYTNGKGQVVREQASGLYSDYVYDATGKAVITVLVGMDVEDASSAKVTLALYDKEGNQIHSIINPIYKEGDYVIDTAKTMVTTSEYDSNGNQVSCTDAEGNKTTYEYDDAKRVTKVKLPDAKNENVTEYEYKPIPENGTIKRKTTNALGNTSYSIEDAEGRNLEISDENAKGKDIVTKQKYDSEGRLARTDYVDGSNKRYQYDELSRLSCTESYIDENEITAVTRYQYDLSDNMIAMVDYSVADGKETVLRYTGYEYDLLGRKVSEYEVDGTKEPTDEQKNAVKIRYTYDVESNLETVKYSNNKDIKELQFHYNDYKWLTFINAIVVVDGQEKEMMLRSYEYHKDGKVKEYTEYTDILGDSNHYLLKKYEYDSFDRVSAMDYYNDLDLTNPVESYRYTYNKNSDILTEEISYRYPNLIVSEQKAYEYDSLGQLIKSTTKDSNGVAHAVEYSCDAVGNRLTMTKDGKLTKYTYNQLNQLQTSITTDETGKETSHITYEYDAKGNQIHQKDTVTGQEVAYTYDVSNQLIYVSGVTEEGKTYTQANKYNGNGQRVEKSDDGVVTKYYYQDGVVVYTTDENNTLQSYNYMGMSDNIISTTRYTEDKVSYYVYNKNIQESTTNVVDQAGNSVLGYTYDDFGNPVEYKLTEVVNEITYTGAIYDHSTGLYYMNARYYDARTGRFISQDSYRGEQLEPGTWHLYTYCANNPINYSDPSGHWWISNMVKKAAKAVTKVAKKVVRTVKKVVSEGIKISTNVISAVLDFALSFLPGVGVTTSAIGYLIGKLASSTVRKAIEKGLVKRLGGAIGKKIAKIIGNAFATFGTTATYSKCGVMGKVLSCTSIGSIVAIIIDFYDNRKIDGYIKVFG